MKIRDRRNIQVVGTSFKNGTAKKKKTGYFRKTRNMYIYKYIYNNKQDERQKLRYR